MNHIWSQIEAPVVVQLDLQRDKWESKCHSYHGMSVKIRFMHVMTFSPVFADSGIMESLGSSKLASIWSQMDARLAVGKSVLKKEKSSILPYLPPG